MIETMHSGNEVVGRGGRTCVVVLRAGDMASEVGLVDEQPGKSKENSLPVPEVLVCIAPVVLLVAFRRSFATSVQKLEWVADRLGLSHNRKADALAAIAAPVNENTRDKVDGAALMLGAAVRRAS